MIIFEQPMFFISAAFDVVGMILVIWGGIIAFLELVQVEVIHFGKDKRKFFLEKLRVEFGQKIVLGIEFFLAGDIIRLIATPSEEVLIRVGAIVIIRTILAYFLSKEIDKHK